MDNCGSADEKWIQLPTIILPLRVNNRYCWCSTAKLNEFAPAFSSLPLYLYLWIYWNYWKTILRMGVRMAARELFIYSREQYLVKGDHRSGFKQKKLLRRLFGSYWILPFLIVFCKLYGNCQEQVQTAVNRSARVQR